MKKGIKILVLMLLLTILQVNCVSAKDYYTFNNHSMQGGVGQYGNYRRYYYILNSASDYKGNINKAMDNWVNTDYRTSLSFRNTTERKNSVIDFMATSKRGEHSAGVLAWTEFYKHGGESVNPEKSNWKYTYIKLYTPNFNKEKCNLKGTIAHEMGHSFGLAHNNGNTGSIMCQTKYGRTATKAHKCDLKGINHLYN